MMNMKRLFAGMAAALLAAVLFFPVKVSAISAESAILLDANTGRVLYEKNADRRSLIASTTKIMTALVVCEQCNVLDRVRIPQHAVGIEGSSMYLLAGEVLTVQDLLYGLLLHSGNDAAVALAIYCGGTVEGFAELMNDKAQRLGMINSHFVNPHGLDNPEHYSSARDMAILAAHAMENPIFAQTVSTKTVRIGQRQMRNHNKLLWRIEGADGVKTGYTRAAGRILVSSAVRNNRRLIAVTINAPQDWADHAYLIEQGFSRFDQRKVIGAGQVLGSRSVLFGEQTEALIISSQDFSYALADDERVKVILGGYETVFAPVYEGGDAGFAYVMLDDRVIGKIPLLYGQTVEQKAIDNRSFWKKRIGKGTA